MFEYPFNHIKVILFVKRHFLYFLLFILLTNPSLATVRYVKVNAAGSNNGSSWSNAYTDLQSALAVAVSGDSVWVAAGTYKTTTAVPYWEGATFAIPPGVALFGGFAGTETSLPQRNISANTTVLSGNIGNTASAGSWHVVTMNNATPQTRLDGFVVSDGYADGTTTDLQQGAGLYISGAGSAVVANCTFTNNYSADHGAALAKVWTGRVSIGHCNFINNNSQHNGGAIYTSDTTFVQACTFTGNHASNAGAAAYFPGTGLVTIDRCVFSGNTAQIGVVFCDDYNTSITSNTLMAGNVTSYCVFCVQQAIPNSHVHKIINSTIADNKTYFNTQEAVKLNPAAEIRNSILWGNNGSAQVPSGLSGCSYNVIQGGVTQPDNFSTDPQFLSAAGSAAAPFNAATYNYSLNASSVAVDKGDNSFIPSYADSDVVGSQRVYGRIVDIGAYEVPYCNIPVQITAGGPLSFCPGGNVTLTANTGTYSYAWSNGAGTPSVTVAASGNYIVSVSDNSCRGYDTATVMVWPAPVPTIVQNGGTLSTSTSYASYQWKNGNVAIPGAVNPTFTPTANGSYAVAVTDNNGCLGLSLPYPVTTVSVEATNSTGNIRIYPIPAADYVLLDTRNEVPAKIELLDRLGRNSDSKCVHMSAGAYRIDLSDHPSGVYFLRLTMADGTVTARLTIQR